MTITAGQCRAGRALLNISQAELAKVSGVSQRAISNFEAGATAALMRANIAAIVGAFEKLGVEFTPDGVRLKQKDGR
jgi:transcriptional regulator with XRE-family HTH domain